MELPPVPTGFEKATGVVEQRRECSACNHVYPATHSGQNACPKCRSTATKPLDQSFPRLAT